MKLVTRSVLAVLTSISLVFGLSPSLALADDSQESPITASGTYHFISNEGSTISLEDEFEFRESCFTRSSFLGCNHLAEMSSVAAIASAAVYTNDDERDNSQNSANIEALLADMGFEDVESNAYAKLEKLEDSAGCTVGHMTIKDGSETYTLLAVMPRSAGYKQEWGGNFTVGTDGMHEGFKAGRDEILRFVKQYITEHGLNGNLKIWTAGHSRGAALTNALGAFFVEGGGGYFDNVAIAPEDVYCYCFATPSTVVAENATKAQILSVAGARGGEYTDDTPGEPFEYTESDAGSAINPHEGVYACIRSCAPDYDIITLLPPTMWGFTYFGVDLPINDGSDETKDKMLAELQNISEYAYDRYINGGDESDYTWKTFDFNALEFVDDENAPGSITQADMFAQRINGLAYNAQTRLAYVEDGYQDTLVALAAIYGMDKYDFFPGLIGDTATVIKAAALSYMAYASERLQEEGRADNETEAIANAIEELLSYITDKPIDPETFTVDDLLTLIAVFITDGGIAEYDEEDGSVIELEFTSKSAEAICGFLADIIADGDKGIVYAFAKYCAYGTGTAEEPDEEGAQEMRQTIYSLVGMLAGDYPDIIEAVGEDGSNNAIELLKAALPLLTTRTNDDGTETTYDTVADAADAFLADAIDNGMTEVLNSGRYDEGTEFYEDLIEHGETLKEHVGQLRRLLIYALLYTDGKAFDTEENVRNISTFVAQTQKIELAHYNEVYVAWMRAKDMSEHVVSYETTSGDGSTWAKGSTNTLDFRFSRSEEDSKAMRHFTGLLLDDATLDESNYTAESGSVIAKLDPAYLEALAEGEHTLTATFDDGNDPAATFTITSTEEPVTPVPSEDSDSAKPGKTQRTGDQTPIALILVICAVSGCLLAVARRRIA